MFVACIMSLCIHDAILAFADFFVAVNSITLRQVPCTDSEIRTVSIVYEGDKKELFPLIRNKIEEYEENDTLNGWTYTLGEAGKAWTRIQSSSEGNEIEFTARSNPESYFTVFNDRWSGAIEMTINQGESQYYDFYKEEGSTELVRIKPFENDHRVVVYEIILHIVATLFFAFMVQCKSLWDFGFLT